MDSAGGGGGEPGVWVPLRVLRQLDLPPATQHRLIATLRAETAGRAQEDPLLGELTELAAAALREALERQEPEAALAAHDLLLAHVIELAAARPEVAAVLWQRYGDLLGQLTVQVHGQVIPRDGQTPDFGAAERAGDGALCLRMAEVLERAAPHPWPVPDWLPVLEQQLVQHGALAFQQRIGTDGAAAGPCLDLFLRLSRLLDPLPDWVAVGCQSALARVIDALPGAAAISAGELAQLVARVGRLPVAAERRPAFEAALLRARFSLELQQQGRGAAGAAPSEVLEPEWLDDDDADGGGAAAALPPLRLVATAADPSQEREVFSLAPFLTGDGEGATAALAAFLEPWQTSGRPADHPIASLVESLGDGGLPPGDDALMVLREAATLWQERLGPQVGALPAVDWRPGALVVELDPLELMVLRQAAGAAEPLEEALAELRRRHHDDAFWAAAVPAAGTATEAQPGALEVLRRFQLQGGFYATTQAPLDSLRHWARPALQALLQAQVWSAAVATQGLWLPWELQGRPGRLRQPPRGSALLELLGGAEVVLVGHGGEALQEAHRAGRLFSGGAFGLRCLEVPESRHPHRPAAGFEHSLEALLADVETLYRERPFTVLLATGGAYRLPLAQAIGSRFGVLAVAGASPLVGWLEGHRS
ncbi:hypothetical protein KBY84_15285 [Cyanobium sp. N.Huapi 1H5]|uniref:hypothetical protein n=1 Tax=Cyanobium sp. N.Huapi 1H5 TaxID=2823719 RepID=UPI0020CF2D26|nr:hypothetical protein [Cyanobium sp. N.Huapi 1H5]MCP9838863.1 hypothetical protein [Cyanobium sp. N.Huapi 1H5]